MSKRLTEIQKTDGANHDVMDCQWKWMMDEREGERTRETEKQMNISRGTDRLSRAQTDSRLTAH